MIYTSTRNSNISIFSSEAIVNGIALDGGLYVPKEIPTIDFDYENLLKMNYKELAYFIIKKYLTDFEDSELMKCVERAYDSKFDTPIIAPIKEIEGVHFLELYHGPTLAFKDMALSILPQLLNIAAVKQNIKKKIVILTATSGDTGKAALEGFANVENTLIIVFYPGKGVSEIQKLQMITAAGKNTFVVGIDGNFDDAQDGVKQIFNDNEFVEMLYENGYILSSANSINIGRLIPQIVYYFYGYLNLIKDKKIGRDELINIVVPTGNFGNILAAYYAEKMGLPVNKLICASNENNVLYDFLTTGSYDRVRKLILTSSPSMDILLSSNLERLLYEISNHNSELVKNLMSELLIKGKYEITDSMKKELNEFFGDYSTEEETFESIKEVYNSCGYVMDTHTSVAYSVYKKYKKTTKDETPTIIVSTASPFKFCRSVCNAIGIKVDVDTLNDFTLIEELSNVARIKIPQSIKALKHQKIVHNNSYSKLEMKSAVAKFLKV